MGREYIPEIDQLYEGQWFAGKRHGHGLLKWQEGESEEEVEVEYGHGEEMNAGPELVL